VAFPHQRLEPAGRPHVGPVVGSRGDRVHRGDGHRVTRLHPAQGAGGEDPDPDDADGRLAGTIEEPSEIVTGKAARDGRARARVEEVVADLSGVR